jgi:putative transposase
LSYPEEIRRVIYTTNAIESLNYSLRKVTRNRLAFPTTDAAMKLCFMAIQNISKKWRQPIKHWSQALNHLAITFEGRVPV